MTLLEMAFESLTQTFIFWIKIIIVRYYVMCPSDVQV